MTAPAICRPRVCHYPAYESSAGQDAIDYAAACGIDLDPWQQLDLKHALAEDENGDWAAFEVAEIVARQNGKGELLLVRELAGLELFGEKLIFHTAQEMKTALEAFRRVESVYTNVDELRRKVKAISHSNGKEGIELLPEPSINGRRSREGARLRFVARSKNSGRGFAGADLIFFDEAYALEDEQISAIVPTMSTAPNPQVWYTSSPPLDPVSGSQLFKLRRRALAKDSGLVFIDYGLEGILDEALSINKQTNKPNVDIYDRLLWATTNPAYGIRISEKYVSNEIKVLGALGFARERLGIWPRDIGDDFQVIGELEWMAALRPGSLIVKAKVLSFDISRDRSRAAIGVAGRTADDKRCVELTGTEYEIDARAGTGWLVERIVRIVKANKIATVVVDMGSEAGTEYPALERALKGSGVEIAKLTAGDVARGWGIFYDAVSGEQVSARNLVHIGQPELTTAVKGALKRELAGGHAWDRKNGDVDITPLVAVTNALLGSEQYGHRQAPAPFAVYA